MEDRTYAKPQEKESSLPKKRKLENKSTTLEMCNISKQCFYDKAEPLKGQPGWNHFLTAPHQLGTTGLMYENVKTIAEKSPKLSQSDIFKIAFLKLGQTETVYGFDFFFYIQNNIVMLAGLRIGGKPKQQ